MATESEKDMARKMIVNAVDHGCEDCTYCPGISLCNATCRTSEEAVHVAAKILYGQQEFAEAKIVSMPMDRDRMAWELYGKMILAHLSVTGKFDIEAIGNNSFVKTSIVMTDNFIEYAKQGGKENDGS